MDLEKYMRLALKQAQMAYDKGEVPVGCVIVGPDDQVIARGHNQREGKKNALSHAELDAISKACKKLGDWRLEDCTMFVTLEPCPMCAGAIINARIPKLVYGARDPQMGACAGVINIFEERFGHKPAIFAGVLGPECGSLLSRFFREMRE